MFHFCIRSSKISSGFPSITYFMIFCQCSTLNNEMMSFLYGLIRLLSIECGLSMMDAKKSVTNFAVSYYEYFDIFEAIFLSLSLRTRWRVDSFWML